MVNIKKQLLSLYNKSRKFYYYSIVKRIVLEIQLADHCNLNCVGCSHFSSIADECFLNVDEFEKDCRKFAQLAKKYVYEIHLMGGEPLLHKEISEIIRITRSNFSDSIIKIVTNGILLDRMDTDFWIACKSNNIIIKITPYPININIKKICDLLYEHDVDVESSINDRYKMKFRKQVYDSTGSQNGAHSFKNCEMRICHHLYNGKFFVCPPPTLIKHINKYFGKSFEVTSKDYIDIHQIQNIKPILKYLKKPIPFCRYCNLDATNHDVKWSISKKEISEWT
jgi:hypothetical protein